MKTGLANIEIFLNFRCLIACLLCCLLMLLFLACFVVRDLCRSGCRQNYYLTHPSLCFFLPTILSVTQVKLSVGNQRAPKAGFGAV